MSNPVVRWIMLAVEVWGMVLAYGAYRFNHDPLRAVVVGVCVFGFLGFWALMLRLRERGQDSATRDP